jgi:hypothetical protein
MKKILTGLMSLAVVAALSFTTAQASSVTIGNDTAARTQVDTSSNFTVIDTNHPAASAGVLTNFSYFASNMNAFRFVLVDSSNTVKWVSTQITPAATGVNSFTPASGVSVSTGDNLGLYFASTGTIPFEFTGSAAHFTANGSGMPTTGNTLSFAGSSNRTYSFVASGGTSSASFTVVPFTFDPGNTGSVVAKWEQAPAPPVTAPMTKNDCKKGGWMKFTKPSFRNQGSCISFAIHHPGQTPSSGNFFLELEKNAPTATNAAAGATLNGIDNIVLSQLGFDFQGFCGAGAPRFNVTTSTGKVFFFGCSSGTATDLGNGWTRVRFTNANASPQDGTSVFPGFGNVTVTSISIVQDEMGQVKLDNIDVNGTLVGNP